MLEPQLIREGPGREPFHQTRTRFRPVGWIGQHDIERDIGGFDPADRVLAHDGRPVLESNSLQVATQDVDGPPVRLDKVYAVGSTR